jgi:REP element-mobilizing transposase RayT
MNATNPNYSHTYNPVGPVAYFITFHTYGTWFHGDDRGSINRKGNNTPGSPMIAPDPQLEKIERSRLKHPPVKINPEQCKIIDSTIREVIAHNKWMLHALNVRTEHVHLVLTANKRPELVMNSLKSWCTRRLRENGLLSAKTEPWSRHGSTRYLWDERELRDAMNYVLYGQDG